MMRCIYTTKLNGDCKFYSCYHLLKRPAKDGVSCTRNISCIYNICIHIHKVDLISSFKIYIIYIVDRG